MSPLMVGREELGGRKAEACLVWTLASGLVVEWRLESGDEDIFREVAGRCRRRWVWAFGRGCGWLVGVCRGLWGARSNPCGCYLKQR